MEKKQSSASTSTSTSNKNSSSNGADKEAPTRKELDKIANKESKRDKDDSENSRKRDRSEKRRDRERKTISPPPYYPERSSSQDRYYNDIERDHDRDLSSISNSSNGSTNRRSQESPDHERGKIFRKSLY